MQEKKSVSVVIRCSGIMSITTLVGIASVKLVGMSILRKTTILGKLATYVNENGTTL